MFVPTNTIVATIMVALALFGWGTQTNSVIDLKVSPGIYHFDFIIWRTIWVAVICVLIGTKWIPPEPQGFIENILEVVHSGTSSMLSHFGGALLAGVTDMLFQVFLFANVDGSGLSSSVPLQVGTATLFGTFLTFAIDHRAHLIFLILGVTSNIIAVFLNAYTYSLLHKDNQKMDGESLIQTPEAHCKFSTTKVAIIAVIGSVMGVFFGPGTALAGKEPNAFNPYSLSLMFSFFGLLFTPLPSYLLMKYPFQGESCTLKDWWNCSWRDHLPAIGGALYWAFGTLGYALAAPHLGYAVAYVFGQSTPFVTSLYSIFYWKEFSNASKKTWFWEIMMLLSFASSLGFMCLAHEFIVCSVIHDYQQFIRFTIRFTSK